MKNGKAEPIKNAILYEPVISRTKPNGNGPIALPNTPIESARPCISPKYLRPKLFAKVEKPKKRRRGVHSKNASRGQTGYKKKYRGQGRKH